MTQWGLCPVHCRWQALLPAEQVRAVDRLANLLLVEIHYGLQRLGTEQHPLNQAEELLFCAAQRISFWPAVPSGAAGRLPGYALADDSAQHTPKGK